MAGSFACKSNAGVAPQEQLLGTMAGNRRLSIGLPAEHNGGEKRFPLTPEGVALLTKEGYRVFVESGAGEGIKYSDLHYTEAGAQATTASEVFSCYDTSGGVSAHIVTASISIGFGRAHIDAKESYGSCDRFDNR